MLVRPLGDASLLRLLARVHVNGSLSTGVMGADLAAAPGPSSTDGSSTRGFRGELRGVGGLDGGRDIFAGSTSSSSSGRRRRTWSTMLWKRCIGEGVCRAICVSFLKRVN